MKYEVTGDLFAAIRGVVGSGPAISRDGTGMVTIDVPSLTTQERAALKQAIMAQLTVVTQLEEL